MHILIDSVRSTEWVLTLAAWVVEDHGEDDNQDSKQAAAYYEDDLEENAYITDVQWVNGRKPKAPRQVEKDTDAEDTNVVSVPTRLGAFSCTAALCSNDWSEDKNDSCEDKEDASNQEQAVPIGLRHRTTAIKTQTSLHHMQSQLVHTHNGESS